MSPNIIYEVFSFTCKISLHHTHDFNILKHIVIRLFTKQKTSRISVFLLYKTDIKCFFFSNFFRFYNGLH